MSSNKSDSYYEDMEWNDYILGMKRQEKEDNVKENDRKRYAKKYRIDHNLKRGSITPYSTKEEIDKNSRNPDISKVKPLSEFKEMVKKEKAVKGSIYDGLSRYQLLCKK